MAWEGVLGFNMMVSGGAVVVVVVVVVVVCSGGAVVVVVVVVVVCSFFFQREGRSSCHPRCHPDRMIKIRLVWNNSGLSQIRFLLGILITNWIP
jgi:hypothetical protein